MIYNGKWINLLRKTATKRVSPMWCGAGDNLLVPGKAAVVIWFGNASHKSLADSEKHICELVTQRTSWFLWRPPQRAVGECLQTWKRVLHCDVWNYGVGLKPVCASFFDSLPELSSCQSCPKIKPAVQEVVTSPSHEVLEHTLEASCPRWDGAEPSARLDSGPQTFGPLHS